ncbi:MAG: group 1 truncated hemoglobin [Rhodospirillaceae bacterium]|nr:group 1 truncated hemoglobin [Rhodospirillaceae bacterium]
MSTLLERIGGEDAVKAVINAFYDKVFTDEALKPFFADTDFAKQRVRQTKFVVQFLGGKMPTAHEYMRNAHRKYVHEMGLGEVHFDIVVGHLAVTMQEFNVPAPLIAEVAAGLETLRNDVLDVPVKDAA